MENVKDGGKQGFMVQKNEPFSTGVRLNQIGGAEGIRTPVQKYKHLIFLQV